MNITTILSGDPSDMSKVRAIEELFGEYIELKSEQERTEFLKKLSADDPKLRMQVEKLAAAHREAGSFLDAGTETAHQEKSDGELVGRKIGRYKLLHVVGEGGMGTVYLAEQTVPVKRRVAVKIINTVYGDFAESYFPALIAYSDGNVEEALDLLSVCNQSKGQSTEHHWAKAFAERWTEEVQSSKETPQIHKE